MEKIAILFSGKLPLKQVFWFYFVFIWMLLFGFFLFIAYMGQSLDIRIAVKMSLAFWVLWPFFMAYPILRTCGEYKGGKLFPILAIAAILHSMALTSGAVYWGSKLYLLNVKNAELEAEFERNMQEIEERYKYKSVSDHYN